VKGPNLKWLVIRTIFLGRLRGRLHPSQCIRRIRPNCYGWSAQVWEAFHKPTQLPIDLVIDPALMTVVDVDLDVLGNPGSAAVGQPSVPPQAWNAMNTAEAGIPRPSARTEKRAGAAPRQHHLAVEGHTHSLRPGEGRLPAVHRARPPSPIRRSTSRPRPHLTIGSRNWSGLLLHKPTGYRHSWRCRRGTLTGYAFDGWAPSRSSTRTRSRRLVISHGYPAHYVRALLGSG
jgi:hypothetical protein